MSTAPAVEARSVRDVGVASLFVVSIVRLIGVPGATTGRIVTEAQGVASALGTMSGEVMSSRSYGRT